MAEVQALPIRALRRGVAIAAVLLSACGGSSADADTRGSDDDHTERSSLTTEAASSVVTDHSRVVVETGEDRWTGFDCPQDVVDVFANPASGRIPAVPTHCVIGFGMTPSLRLEVKAGLANYETGTWTGDEITRHIQVDFQAEHRELDTRSDAIDPASTVTISTWDAEGLIEGELDLTLRTAAGTGTIRGPFTIAFEVQ